MEYILIDRMKFEKLDEDRVKLTLKRWNQAENVPKELSKNGVIPDDLYRNLTPIGFRPAILYGLSMVHKDNILVRAILSSIQFLSFSIAKCLVSLLCPFSNGVFSVYDSFSFVKELLGLRFNTNEVLMASFDITLRCTDIPLHETTDIIIQKASSGSTKFDTLCLWIS